MCYRMRRKKGLSFFLEIFFIFFYIYIINVLISIYNAYFYNNRNYNNYKSSCKCLIYQRLIREYSFREKRSFRTLRMLGSLIF